MTAPRGAYNLMIWIFPVSLMLQKGKLDKRQIVILCTGLCFINNIPFYLPFLYDAGELMLLYLVFAVILQKVKGGKDEKDLQKRRELC